MKDRQILSDEFLVDISEYRRLVLQYIIPPVRVDIPTNPGTSSGQASHRYVQRPTAPEMIAAVDEKDALIRAEQFN